MRTWSRSSGSARISSGVRATANSLAVALAVFASRDWALSITETSDLNTVSFTLTSGITSWSGRRTAKRQKTSSIAGSSSIGSSGLRGVEAECSGGVG
jgi:hypothetical protein